MLELCIKYEITIEMLTVLLLMNMHDKKKMRAYKDIALLYNPTVLNDKEKQALTNKGFLQTKAGGGYLTTRIFQDLFADKYEVANEFWNIYPGYTLSGDNRFPLKNTDITVFRELYIRTINYLIDEHTEIVKDIQYGIDNNFGFTKIDNFVRNKQWIEIRKIRNSTDKRIDTTGGTTLEHDF